MELLIYDIALIYLAYCAIYSLLKAYRIYLTNKYEIWEKEE